MPTASCSPIAAGRSSVIFDAYRIGEGELSVTRDPLQVLSAFEVGIPNVVAFLSAITARSLDLLARRSSGHAALSHVLAGMPERYTDFAHRLRLALHEALRAFSEPSKGGAASFKLVDDAKDDLAASVVAKAALERLAGIGKGEDFIDHRS
jgi:hypothetical protein